MTSLKSSAQHTLAPPVRLTVRSITIALVTLLIAAALALAIALAAIGGADQAGPSNSVGVTASAPVPPRPAERNQPAGLNGPGMRP